MPHSLTPAGGPHHLAVVGSGLSGLAVAYHAAQRPGCTVELFDPVTPGLGGASALAALMHPHSPRGRLIWRGKEGVAASLLLLDFAERFSDRGESVFYGKGRAIRRPCLNAGHVSMFEQAARSLPGLITLTQDPYTNFGAAVLHSSYVINTPVYLKSLFRGLHREFPVNRVDKSVSREELGSLRRMYDHVIICAGAGLVGLVEGVEPRVTLVRGQNVIFEDPDGQRLETARICGEYVIPVEGHRILCGATHEYSRDEMHSPPDLTSALETLSPSLTKIFPPLKACTPLQAAAGVRVAARRTHLGKIPLIGRHPDFENVCFLTGLGSHGLVHHALMAKLLVAAIFDEDGFNTLPTEVRF